MEDQGRLDLSLAPHSIEEQRETLQRASTPPPSEYEGSLTPGVQGQLERLLITVRQLANELETTKEELRNAKLTSPSNGPQPDANIKFVEALSALATSAAKEKHNPWEKDLPKLAKLVKTSRFEPKSERDYEDTLYEWECKARGSGMKDEVLKHLVVHLGSEKVLHVVESVDIPNVTWVQMKDAVAIQLFPYSRYRPELEKEITAVDRSNPVDESLLLLTKQRKRYDQLCKRWSKGNAMSDDRLKEAFLSKLPANRVTACLATERYNDMTFDEFGRHCEMIMASVHVGDLAMGLSREGRKPVNVRVVDVAQVPAAPLLPTTSTPTRSAPSDYHCYNCGEAGHYMRNCPRPKVRCPHCNRHGHRAESCTKLQHAGPLGRTRTGFLRITRGGIHLDLVDEATKRALFESMRTHLEGQEKAYDVAKEKARKKRQDKRAAALLEGLDAEEIASDYSPSETPEATDPDIEVSVSSAGFLDPNQKTPSHYLDISILGIRTPALLDSGAAVSLLPAALWQEAPQILKATVVSCDPGDYPLMGLGGALDITTIIELPIEVSGKTLMQRFFVSSAPTLPILGMDALTSLGLSIDFGSGEVYIRGSTSPLKQSEELGISPLCAHSAEVQPTEEGPTFKLGVGCLPEEAAATNELFLEIPEVWRNPVSGTCNTTLHSIDTGDANPIRSRARRLPPEKVLEVKEQIKTLIASGAIRPSERRR